MLPASAKAVSADTSAAASLAAAAAAKCTESVYTLEEREASLEVFAIGAEQWREQLGVVPSGGRRIATVAPSGSDVDELLDDLD